MVKYPHVYQKVNINRQKAKSKLVLLALSEIEGSVVLSSIEGHRRRVSRPSQSLSPNVVVGDLIVRE